METRTIDLDGADWQIREFLGLEWKWKNVINSNGDDAHFWIPAEVPGSIMWDLFKAGKVSDPYFGINSKLAEWVPARSWVYRKVFHASLKPGERATLCLKGIDYSGEIFLNGQSLGCHEGMFVPFEFDITGMLKEGDNALIVALDSAPNEQPQIGRSSMVRTIKTRMAYGWDFCPHMVHLGLWDSVYIQISGQKRLADVFVSSRIGEFVQGGADRADITIEAETDAPDGYRLKAALEGNSLTAESPVLGGRARIRFSLPNPALWYPNGYGQQHLYQFRVTLLDGQGGVSDERLIRHGIRRVEWELNKGATPEKQPFTVSVNGKQVYLRGVNWVPMDILYGREQGEKMNRLIQLAKKAGVLMFRVWGGGLIERDAFYEACAEAGIMVWQEFIQSASGVDNRTPGNPEYITRVLRDARGIIKRKRNHTALVVWCGGNEFQDDNGYPLDDSDVLLGALGGLVRAMDPQRHWLPTSPSGGFFSNSLEHCNERPDRLADAHGPWEHQGLGEQYKLYNAGVSLLASEFGVGGITNPPALRRVLPKEALWPISKENEYYYHRGAWWINTPLLQEMFGGRITDLENFIKASQYSQFEGLRYAIESNMRRVPRNSGSFPWQFNEPYPNCLCTNQIDYYGNPKPAFYAMKGAYRPLYPALSFDSSLAGESGVLDGKLWLCGPMKAENTTAALKWEAWGVTDVISKGAVTLTSLEPGKAIGSITVNTAGHSIVLVRLTLEQEGCPPLTNEYLFGCERHLGALFDLQPADISLTCSGNSIIVRNRGNVTAFFVFLSAGEDTFFLDNYFCLLPGEERQTRYEGKVLSQGEVFHAEGFNCKAEAAWQERQ
jgi:beta-mannosidase